MKDRLTIVTKYILDFMFYAGIIATVTVPLIYKYVVPFMDRHVLVSREDAGNYFIPLCIIMMICGVFAVLIIHELRKIFKTVLEDDCFVRENVKSLKKMGTYSFCIAVVTLARLFCYVTSAVFVILIVFIIAGLFSKVLAQVFDRAVTYKLENDLTI